MKRIAIVALFLLSACASDPLTGPYPNAEREVELRDAAGEPIETLSMAAELRIDAIEGGYLVRDGQCAFTVGPEGGPLGGRQSCDGFGYRFRVHELSWSRQGPRFELSASGPDPSGGSVAYRLRGQ